MHITYKFGKKYIEEKAALRLCYVYSTYIHFLSKFGTFFFLEIPHSVPPTSCASGLGDRGEHYLVGMLLMIINC